MGSSGHGGAGIRPGEDVHRVGCTAGMVPHWPAAAGAGSSAVCSCLLELPQATLPPQVEAQTALHSKYIYCWLCCCTVQVFNTPLAEQVGRDYCGGQYRACREAMQETRTAKTAAAAAASSTCVFAFSVRLLLPTSRSRNERWREHHSWAL